MTNNYLKLNPNGSITLCAKRTCCPVMEEVDKDNIKITDDCGNFIIIKKEQAALIKDGLELLNYKNQELLCE